VILNTKTGKYYGLNEMGTQMWALLVEKGTLLEACRVLSDAYDVEEEQVQGDMLQLMETLVEKGLLHIEPAA